LDDDREVRKLAELACVRREFAGDDRIQLCLAVETVVRRLIARFDRPIRRTLSILFGIAPAYQGKPASMRRKAAAATYRPTNQATFVRQDVPRLMRLVARAVLEEEEKLLALTRVHQRARPRVRERETESGWLSLFGYYTKLARTAKRLRHDLLSLQEARRDPKHSWSIEDHMLQSLWRLARLLMYLEEFEGSATGGRWILPDASREAAIDAAVQTVRFHSPFNENGESALRVMLTTANGEMTSFVKELEDLPSGQELLGMWEAWNQECNCDLADVPADACDVHLVVDGCERLFDLVEEEWRRVADHYRAASPVDATKVIEMLGRLDVAR
jgi:hypothetical protein